MHVDRLHREIFHAECWEFRPLCDKLLITHDKTQFSLHTITLSRNIAVCTALVCGHNAPLHETWPLKKPNLLRLQPKWQGNDQTDLQCQAARHCHHQVQWATCTAWHWGSGLHSEGEKAPLVWTCGMLQWCSQDSLSYTGWGKVWAWEAQDDMEAADREGLQRVEALGYQPSW